MGLQWWVIARFVIVLAALVAAVLLARRPGGLSAAAAGFGWAGVLLALLALLQGEEMAMYLVVAVLGFGFGGRH